MPLFNWNASLELKISSIDSQHQKLVEYINELYDAMMAGKGNDVLGSVFQKLITYTQDHFAYEEKLFETHGYSETSQHAKAHASLKSTVSDFYTKFQKGEMAVSSELMNFLKEWLMNHILKEDKAYVPFLKNKGVD